MIVTINTDASYSKVLRRGSYAFWIVSNFGRITRSGMLKGKVPKPEVAEMKAIFNALYQLAAMDGVMMYTKHIIVNTDCLNAIHVYTQAKVKIKRYKLNSKHYNRIYRKYEEFLAEKFKDVKIDFRHIKSHQKIESSKQYVNDWCDRESKKHIGALIEKQPKIIAT